MSTLSVICLTKTIRESWTNKKREIETISINKSLKLGEVR